MANINHIDGTGSYDPRAVAAVQTVIDKHKGYTDNEEAAESYSGSNPAKPNFDYSNGRPLV
jgi:hypothetical protein